MSSPGPSEQPRWQSEDVPLPRSHTSRRVELVVDGDRGLASVVGSHAVDPPGLADGDGSQRRPRPSRRPEAGHRPHRGCLPRRNPSLSYSPRSTGRWPPWASGGSCSVRRQRFFMARPASAPTSTSPSIAGADRPPSSSWRSRPRASSCASPCCSPAPRPSTGRSTCVARATRRPAPSRGTVAGVAESPDAGRSPARSSPY